MLRIILKLNDGGDAEKGYYTEKFYRKFKDLMSRKRALSVRTQQLSEKLTEEFFFCPDFAIDSPNIQNDQRRIEHIESLRGVLQDILTVDLLPDDLDFVAIYGRVRYYICSIKYFE